VSPGVPSSAVGGAPGHWAPGDASPRTDRGPNGVWYAALTRLGVIVLAAADLEELHQAAHPAGCGGCCVCRATLPLLQRVVAAARPGARPEAPRPREDPRGPTSPPPEGGRP
jgi:hypothetical protein